MIADTVEAASRSLDKIDEQELTKLADRLVRDKEEDGQLDHCLLTMEELATVKSTLVKTIIAFAHSRVKYPSRDHKESDGFAPSFEAYSPTNCINYGGYIRNRGSTLLPSCL